MFFAYTLVSGEGHRLGVSAFTLKRIKNIKKNTNLDCYQSNEAPLQKHSHDFPAHRKPGPITGGPRIS